MAVIERLRNWLSKTDKSINEVEKKAGLSQGTLGKALRGNTSIGVDKLEKIFLTYPELVPNDVFGTEAQYKFDISETRVQDPIEKQSQAIPYFNTETSASFADLLRENGRQPDDYLHIPGFNDCDFAVNIFGKSMIPDYLPGDIILCKKIEDTTTIFYGEVHLVTTKELHAVKVLKKSTRAGKLILESRNNEFDSFDIDRSQIEHLYIVKGKIQRNTI